MAIFGLGAMVGPAIGPTLGGYIVDNYSWPLIFYINLPIGIAAFVMTLAFIKDQTYVKRSTNPVDWIGLGLLTAGVAGLQFVLERGQREDWFGSQTICIATAISAISVVMFIIRELRDPQPLVDLTVFQSRSFTAGNVIGVVTGFGLYGSALIMPLYFQNVLGFTAMGTGIALLPGAIATAISMPLASRLMKLIDARTSIAIGLVLFAVGCWMVGGLNQDAALGDTLWPRAIQGFALGFMFVPLTTATLSTISREKMANATGVYTLVRQLGGSLGIAILQLVETRRQDSAYATLASGVTMANQNVANALHGVANQTGTLTSIWSMVMLNAETVAYNDVFRLCAIVFIVALPSVLLLKGGKPATGPEPLTVAE
jgi:DHA2 family multidrug resistance protein